VIKRKIMPEHICVVDLQGNILYTPPGLKPSGETGMHLRFYQKREDVVAVMHAHPPLLVGFSFNEDACRLMALPTLPESMTQLGQIVTIPYVAPNSEALDRSFDTYMMQCNGFIMQNHGCLVCSSNSILDTVEMVHVMETMAQSLTVARIMGDDIHTLNYDNIQKLDDLLQIRGESMPAARGYFSSMADVFCEKREAQ
jgi:L-fuculose-phosphate aldolase